MSEKNEEIAKQIFYGTGGKYPSNLLKAVEQALDSKDSESAQLRGEVEALKNISLHRKECPYLQFSTMPRHLEPLDSPACTCPEDGKANYWAVQDFLHRGYLREAEEKLASQSLLIEKLMEAIQEAIKITMRTSGGAFAERLDETYVVLKEVLALLPQDEKKEKK